jgi:hypothetical protein
LWDWFPYIHDVGADILTPDLKKNAMNTPKAIAATQFLADLQTKYKVAPPAGGYDWAADRALFKSGRTAMQHGEGPEILDLQAAKPGFACDIVLAPKPHGATKQTVMATSPAGRAPDAAGGFPSRSLHDGTGAGRVGARGLHQELAGPLCLCRVHSHRHGDFAVAGAAVQLHVDDSHLIDRASIVLCGVGATPTRAEGAEQRLQGTQGSPPEIAAAAQPFRRSSSDWTTHTGRSRSGRRTIAFGKHSGPT